MFALILRHKVIVWTNNLHKKLKSIDANYKIGISSYKLAQFVSKFIKTRRPGFYSHDNFPNQLHCAMIEEDDGEDENSVESSNRSEMTVIKPRTARIWLNKLGYQYTYIKKGVFLDGHERPDVVEYRAQFLKKVEALGPYLVKFRDDGSMKEKVYPSDCAVNGPNKRPVILITYDESIFSANDGRHQAWLKKDDAFLRPKRKGKGIIVSDFLLPWKRLNLLHLQSHEREALIASGIPEKAAEIFEYGQEDGYWNTAKVVNQIQEKALPIAQPLYPEYQIIIMFDNIKSHAVFAKNALRVGNMSKGVGGVQSFLRDRWYEKNQQRQIQPMWYSELNSKGVEIRIQKGIQQVLEKRNLWPSKGLKLKCPKPKCNCCVEKRKCKECVKAK